ncbi:MAG: putative transporter [Bacteroidaceae bacterium]|nr:putative transporter [Bacteroidaceae bacterium]
MDWLSNLFTNTESVGHIVVIYALVISIGLLLGRIKVAGISLGVTFVLFAGILLGHVYHAAGIASDVGGFAAPGNVLTFIQDFGLILFVYCIGLQVGPGFFESFKTGGMKMNAIAVGIILLNVACCIGLYFAVFYKGGPISGKNSIDLAMMVGVLCGAITNTPGLGAATEACNNIFGAGAPSIANGYACAYPLGVVGIILATILIRYLTRTSLNDAQKEIEDEKAANPHATPHRMTINASNQALAGKSIMQIRTFIGRDFVCSRLLHDGHVSIPNRNTLVELGDKLYINCALDDAEAIVAFIGNEVQIEWEEQDVKPVTKHILVTQSAVNGKTIGEMHFSSIYGCTVTRIRRGDLNLYAEQNLRLQIGDRLVVNGPEDQIDRVAAKMGNSVKKLNHPNLTGIFIGIFIGIIFGAIPVAIPGVPTPVKLGLAGGPLVISILIGAYGWKLKLNAYTTTSANMMLREVGLALFLASVGIKAGAQFLETVVDGDGIKYVWCGFLITVVPILIMGIIGRKVAKINYFTLMGLIAGSNTDPPALAFANQTAGNDAPAVGYSTVYPLSMFLRILTAQLIILLLCTL